MNAGAVGSALIFVALVVLSLVGAGFEIFSHDVSYYLYVSREVLTGALPFRDFIDPNLPTIIYLGVPVAWLSEALGVEVWTGFRWFVLGLQLVALGLCARLVRGGVAPGDPVLQWAVMTGLLTATCLVPMGLVFVDGSHFGFPRHAAGLLHAGHGKGALQIEVVIRLCLGGVSRAEEAQSLDVRLHLFHHQTGGQVCSQHLTDQPLITTVTLETGAPMLHGLL